MTVTDACLAIDVVSDVQVNTAQQNRHSHTVTGNIIQLKTLLPSGRGIKLDFFGGCEAADHLERSLGVLRPAATSHFVRNYIISNQDCVTILSWNNSLLRGRQLETGSIVCLLLHYVI